MKIYIITDIEGISGIPNGNYHLHSSRFFADGRRYYTNDINVCAAACFEAGADEVVVRDGHGPGDYAIWDQLDPRIEIIQGQTPGQCLPGSEGADAMICLGFHAMAGTAAAVLEHTFSSETVQNMWINGELVGEFAILTLVAAEKNIPSIMISGDDKVCAEAKSLVPDIVACEVKKGLSCHGARLLPMPKAHEVIKAGTMKAIKKIGAIKPPAASLPVTIRLESVERPKYPMKTGPGVKRINERMTEVSAESIEEAFLTIR